MAKNGKKKSGDPSDVGGVDNDRERRIKAATFDWATIVPEVRALPITDLVPYSANPRKNDKAVKPLSNSVHDFGFLVPVVVDNFEHMELASGHTRLKSVLKLCEQDGRDPATVKVNVVSAEHLTPEQLKAFRIADNKVAELAEWDDDLLAKEIAALPDFNFGDFGFDLSDLETKDANTEEDDFEVDEETIVPRCVKGEVYILGDHRLMCGSSTDPADVAKLMAGDKAVFVFTDPPWNVAYGADQQKNNPQGHKKRSILNDSMSTEDFKDFMDATWKSLNASTVPGAMVYAVMSAQEWGNMMLTLKDNGLHWSSTIIWAKDSLVLSRKDYHTQYEPIWYGWTDGSRVCPLEDRKQSDLWSIPRPKRSDIHPMMKPIELVVRALVNSSHKGDVTLDLFGGSGTTLIASERTGRKCRMMELDPKYAEAIMLRWEAETGRKAVKAE